MNSITLTATICAGLAAACSANSSNDEATSTTQALETRKVGLNARRAERGLAISPVPIDTSHMSRQQKAQVGLGSYIANGTSDCAGCHTGPQGFLSGGNPFKVDDAGHVVFSRNLTPDVATGLRMTLAQFKSVIRTGVDLHVDPTKQLLVMPWLIFRWMSDDDIEALYAYLLAVPAVSNAVPSDNKAGLTLPASTPFPGYYNDGDIARSLPRGGESFDSERGLAIAPLKNPDLRGHTLEQYASGSYIANSMAHCQDCHSNPDRTPSNHINTASYLLGGGVYNVPPPLQPILKQVRAMSANLEGKVHGFFNEPDDSFARYKAIMTTGTHADESPPRPLGFPMNLVAANLANLLDDDLVSLYTYEKHVPSISGSYDVQRQNYARYCTADADCGVGESCASATHECAGKACSADSDCDACQTCTSGSCAAPLPTSACLATSR